MKRTIKLFIKPWCGWCHEAQDWLEDHGIEHEVLDVTADPAAYREMVALSGQQLAPVLSVDGRVLADFDTEQLQHFWNQLDSSL